LTIYSFFGNVKYKPEPGPTNGTLDHTDDDDDGDVVGIMNDDAVVGDV
jgi:hypothetical protein